MANTSKRVHFKPSKRIKTPTVVSFKTKSKRKPRQSKPANSDLAELIRVVNLIPKDAVLPKELVKGPMTKDPELLEALGTLPEDFRDYLRELFELESQKSFHLIGPGMGDMVEGVSLGSLVEEQIRVLSVLNRYSEVRSARLSLIRFIRLERAPNTMFRGNSIVMIDQTHIAKVRLDWFSRAIQGVDVRNIRQCAICEKFFFARRVDSMVCDPKSKCAKTFSKRQERKNAKLREAMAEKSRKKKLQLKKAG